MQTEGQEIAPQPTELHYEVNYAEDHRVFYVEGVTGSVSPRNYLRVSFFQEYISHDPVVKHEVTFEGGQGRLGDMILEDRDVIHMTRDLVTTVVLNRKSLADLIPWLQQHLESMVITDKQDLGISGEVQQA